MDLRQFYRKIREIESTIPDKYPLVTSLATGDGGKEGLVSEVPRYQAARMIVEGKARLSTDEEKKDYVDSIAAVHKQIEELEATRRAHFGFLFPPDQKQVAPKPKSSSK
jgi:hypothetical protein